MLPNPDEALRSLGATIQAARLARGYTQQRLAKEAGVSRGQLALLEAGGNVSIKFVLKLAGHLDLQTIPLGGNVQLTSGGSEGLNVMDLLQSLDLVSAVVEHLRRYALQSVLPRSERGTLGDTIALREFVSRHLDNPAGMERLADAIVQLTDDVTAKPAPAADSKPAAAGQRGGRRSGRRSG